MNGIVIEQCPDICDRSWWQPDPVFPRLGQHNCPHRFGVTHAAATVDGQARCPYLRRKVES